MSHNAPDLNIEFNGTDAVLNPLLIKWRGIQPEAIERLKAGHLSKSRLFQEMARTPKADTAALLVLASKIDDVEFVLQENWGFPLDATYHEWFLVPHCSCNVTLNQSLRGSPLRLVNETCPVHGPLMAPIGCETCPTGGEMPFGNGHGMFTREVAKPSGHRLVNVTCTTHGRPLLSFQPPA